MPLRRTRASCATRTAASILALASPLGAAAQVAPAAATPADAPRAAAVGRVVDSLVTGRPLAGAELWLDGAPVGATTDSAGHFRLEGVEPGWHTLGFVHSALDSVGVAAPLVRVELAELGETRVDLATPSAATFHQRTCGAPPGEGEGVLVGVVQDAEDERPVGGATVTTAWIEWTLAREGLERSQRSSRVNADVAGRFIVCFVPADVVVEASAEAGGRASGAVDVELGQRGFAVRQLRVGAASAAVVAGLVRDTLGRGVPHARVSVARTELVATTDSAGAFRLAGVPAGSQTIEVRAVGYAQTRVTVVARAAAPAQVQVTVGRTQVLPTVAVVGRSRPRADVSGFEDRRRGGAGYYLTEEQIAKRQAFRPTDLLRTVPGVSVQFTPGGKRQIVITRGASNACFPTVVLDGTVMYAGATELDDWLPAADVRAVEVYPSFASVPNEYRVQNSTCGAVLIWTRTQSR